MFTDPSNETYFLIWDATYTGRCKKVTGHYRQHVTHQESTDISVTLYSPKSLFNDGPQLPLAAAVHFTLWASKSGKINLQINT
jgi:hypothetical protein